MDKKIDIKIREITSKLNSGEKEYCELVKKSHKEKDGNIIKKVKSERKLLKRLRRALRKPIKNCSEYEKGIRSRISF